MQIYLARFVPASSCDLMISHSSSRFFMRALALAAMLIGVPVAAHAQSILATVDGTPVTTLEVQERQRLTMLTTRKDPGQKKVLEQVIDEALIGLEAKRRGITVNESDVDARYNMISESVKLPLPQLRQALAQAGTSESSFKQSIRAQLLYRKVIGSQFNPNNAVSEKEIAAKLASQRQDGEKSYRYTLRQIIFVLPKNAGAGQVSPRMAQANALRAKFTSCDAGLAAAKGLRDVAIKDPVFRTSAQFGVAFGEKVKKLKVGQATPPERGDFGVEIVAICDKVEIKDDSSLRQKVQLELADEKIKTHSDGYLKSLRNKATIKYR